VNRRIQARIYRTACDPGFRITPVAAGYFLSGSNQLELQTVTLQQFAKVLVSGMTNS
jgi:hypothetical protein